MVGDLAKFRDLLSLLVVREVRIRYARAVLGAAWAVFGPLMTMVVFTLLDFGRLIPEGSRWAGIPYPLFAYVGVVFWAHFQASLTQATPSLVVAADILRKSSFPREVVPLAKVLAAVFDLLIGLGVLVILMAGNAHGITVTALAVPFIFLVQVVFTAGAALLLSALNLFYRDVNYLVQVLIVLAMFATSVVYPIAPSSPAAAAVLGLNPMSSILDSYRECLLLGTWPVATLVPGIVGAVLMFLAGSAVFRSLAPRFAEEV